MQVQELLETNIIDQIHFDSESDKEAFLADYGEMLFSRIIERVSNVLNEQQTLTISQEMDHNASMADILKSLIEYVPHLPIIIGEEVLDMKEDMMSLLQVAK